MYIPLMNYSKYATPPIPTVNIGAGNENWNISFENKQYRPNLRQTVGTIYWQQPKEVNKKESGFLYITEIWFQYQIPQRKLLPISQKIENADGAKTSWIIAIKKIGVYWEQHHNKQLYKMIFIVFMLVILSEKKKEMRITFCIVSKTHPAHLWLRQFLCNWRMVVHLGIILKIQTQ